MSRTKGTYTLTSNIEPKVGAPLDARTIVKLLADLTASNTFEYPYKGMKVFVEENNKSYTLIGSDPTVSTNWIEDNSGGHTIKNPAGTAMTQRSNLQFVDLTISDDSTNDATKVESVHVIQSESELENLPDGLYMLNEDESTVIDGNLVGYDNTNSDLNAENVQDAIDEVVETLDDKIDISTKGVANGVAELDENGKVPSSQLPSYVDDVIEVADYDHLPATGETGKIYVTLDTNKTYRWGGTEYVEISESLALGETSSTAYRGDRGKIAYDHSQLTSGNPHNVTKSEVGLGNVDNTSDSTKKTNFTGSLAAGDSGFVQGGTIYVALNKKADTVTNATNGNLAGLNGSGNLTDSGWNGAKDTTSISGNPISISGLKANQLAVNPIITFEPIQAGSGTPSPSNVRAISGYDKVEVESCGKNIWDGKYSEENKFLNADGTLTSTNGWYVTSYVPVKANASYTVSYAGNGLSGSSMCWYNAAKEFIASKTWSSAREETISMPSNAKYLRVSYHSSTYNFQIEENNAKTTYEPPVKSTSISESLGQTVYWGRYLPRTGEFEVLGVGVDMGDLTWTFRGTNIPFYSATLSNYYWNDSTQAPPLICSCYETVAQSNRRNNTIAGYNIATNAIMINDDSYNGDANAFTAAVTGQMLVYGIQTPFTIQLTPHEISLLKDYAYVSTNGTNIALDYHNGELASLADVSQLGETVNELENRQPRRIVIEHNWGNVTEGTNYAWDLTAEYPEINFDTLLSLNIAYPIGSGFADGEAVMQFGFGSASPKTIYIRYACHKTQNNMIGKIIAWIM